MIRHERVAFVLASSYEYDLLYTAREVMGRECSIGWTGPIGHNSLANQMRALRPWSASCVLMATILVLLNLFQERRCDCWFHLLFEEWTRSMYLTQQRTTLMARSIASLIATSVIFLYLDMTANGIYLAWVEESTLDNIYVRLSIARPKTTSHDRVSISGQ